MNGTHVNKLLVGKGKTYRLNHTEVISVFHQDFDVFLYIYWMELPQKIFVFQKIFYKLLLQNCNLIKIRMVAKNMAS